MQFEQMAGGERVELPKPSIDTGMGLERIAAVLQGSHDNYDTDLLRAIIEASAEASGAAPDGEHSVSHRVIADHLRASSFLIADGVLPSNEGRGYVLRRIMRRAMRHVHRLGMAEPMLWRLVPTLVREMGGHFGELQRAEALITETLKLEEARFNRTLDRGMKLLDEETGRLGEGEALAGEVAFKLYDTYGFPLDLTQDVLRGQGRGVDQAGFDTAMERQRAAARKSWVGSGRAIVVDGAAVEVAEAGQAVQLLVNQTPFYGESGGQMGDCGIAFTAGGCEVRIDDTQKHLGDLHVHIGEVVKGKLALGDAVELRVDGARRAGLRANHSATHLLHEALRRRLGDHVTQKGSLVAPDRLRFDISHPAALSQEDIAVVEALVNARIRDNAATTTLYMTPDEAVEVRREVRRRGTRRFHGRPGPGQGPGRGGPGARLLNRALRRHPRAAHRRHRLLQDRRRERPGRRRAPHRGGRRRRRGRFRAPPGRRVGPGGGRPQGGAGRHRGAGRGPAGRPQAPRAGAHRAAPQAGDRRRGCLTWPREAGHRRYLLRLQHRRRAAPGIETHGRRPQESHRLGRGGAHFRDRGEGLPGGRRD
jgi:alanyl-tRNA synthetase